MVAIESQNKGVAGEEYDASYVEQVIVTTEALEASYLLEIDDA